jgi:hypothetical protein
MLAVWSSPYPK